MSKSTKRYIKIVACPRCGVKRQMSKTKNQLCGDCRYVLTKEERLLWMEKERTAA